MAVRGRHDNGDTRLPDFEAAQTVDHAQAIDRKLLLHFPPDLLHLPDRHGLVRLVFQVTRFPPVQVVADDPLEYHHRALLGRLEFAGQLRGRDRLASDAVEVRALQWFGRAPTHWGQERHFVTVPERPRALDDFLVHSRQERLAHFLEAREATLVLSTEVLQFLPVRNLDLLLAASGQIVHEAEKQHVDLHCANRNNIKPRNSSPILAYSNRLPTSIHDPMPGLLNQRQWLKLPCRAKDTLGWQVAEEPIRAVAFRAYHRLSGWAEGP